MLPPGITPFHGLLAAILLGKDDDDVISLSPHALPLWTVLGLEPCGPRRDVVGMVCASALSVQFNEPLCVCRGLRADV